VTAVDTDTARILPTEPVADLTAYRDTGGGRAVAALADAAPDDLVALLASAGLRGRGGAGFPTARKWDTVRVNAHGVDAPSVVVNGAEGEPGSFKDRMLMRRDPFRVIEGALVAAHAVGATHLVFALKETSTREADRLRRALEECDRAGWLGHLRPEVFLGPRSYLYGEETALLEAIDGRPPFPRIAPPFRRGVDDVAVDEHAGDRTAAKVELAGPSRFTEGIPTLVDNVETLAHVACIVAEGAEWFRAVGTEQSPGTIVCTVSGDAPRHGVAEYPLGTPLRDVLTGIGDVDPASVLAVMPGVSAAWLTASDLDVPLTYEDVAAVGSGLGTAGFIVLDHDTDLLAVAAGVARFLAVESCGQCRPCKQDGRIIAKGLAELVDGDVDGTIEADKVRRRVERSLVTVGDSARCALAAQQQAAVGANLERFAGEIRTARASGARRPAAVPVVPILDLAGTRFVLDRHQLDKQPDWTFHPVDSGQAPADRLGPGAPAGSG
jgi:NADH:ubiquinone oxidoreductase subunit F (NADH-binding)